VIRTYETVFITDPTLTDEEEKTVVDALLRRRPRKRVAYFPHRADIASYVAGSVRSGDLVMTMGAGDVTTMGPEIMRAMTGNGSGESA